MNRRLVSRKQIVGMVAVGCVVVLGAARSARSIPADLEPHEYRRLVMGVQARIVLYAQDEPSAAEAAASAFEEMDAVEAVLSDWRVDSEAKALGEASGGPALGVSPALFEALERSREVSELTGGAFDITVGPLVALWRAVRQGESWPTEAELSAARAQVGHAKLELDARARTVRLPVPGMRLDFGGIGKGLASDRALARLGEHGFKRALVEFGGDLALGEAPPDLAGWEVRVVCGGAEGVEVLYLSECGVATSGRSEQFIEHEGRRYSHIIDPRTGLGLEHDLCVTVFAANATLADALASGVSVLGSRAGRRLIAGLPGASVRIADGSMRTLFDGTSLAGWTEQGGRYDGDADWTVEDGAIVGRVSEGGRGGLLYTDEFFTDFAFETEVKIDYPFDSGIFLRMVPPDQGGKGAQVTIDYRDGGEISAIYADGFLEHNERQDLLTPGEWNHFEVHCTGRDMRIQVWIDGEPVTDYQLAPNSEGYAPAGRIGIQVHGDRDDPPQNAVRFKNVRIREL